VKLPQEERGAHPSDALLIHGDSKMQYITKEYLVVRATVLV